LGGEQETIFIRESHGRENGDGKKASKIKRRGKDRVSFLGGELIWKWSDEKTESGEGVCGGGEEVRIPCRSGKLPTVGQRHSYVSNFR